MAKLLGAAFGTAFAKHMVEDHKKDIKEYEAEAKKKDAAGNYANETLPTLRKHLETAQGLSEQLPESANAMTAGATSPRQHVETETERSCAPLLAFLNAEALVKNASRNQRRATRFPLRGPTKRGRLMFKLGYKLMSEEHGRALAATGGTAADRTLVPAFHW
jgi:hypothetical protein